jgi:RNA polymerase sigma-70 factor (ECF subfamily)
MHSTSPTLLQRLRGPADEDAWPHFVDLYTPLLYYWARRTGLQDSDAADLVQDVFATLVRKMPEFAYDRRQSFRSWLRTVLMNRYRDLRRRQAARPAEEARGSWSDLATDDPTEELDEAEYRRHLVRKAMELIRDEFHPTTWQACWEHGVAGRSAGEVAAELGVTPNAVYIATSRVLRRLHAELEGLLD